MTITIYDDLILPESVIRAGIRGKNTRSNTRVMGGNGYESVNINWARTLRQYDLGIAPMDVAQWLEIEALHEATDGGAFGFLMQDPKDQTVTYATGNLQACQNNAPVGTVGFGYGVPSYSLNLRYSTINSIRTYDRRITRPKSAIALKRGGVVQTSGAAPGNYAVSYTTGIVTFVYDAQATPSAITVGNPTELTFSGTSFTSLFATGGRVYLQRVTGTSSTAHNNLSHSISSIASNKIFINTDTTGLTVTGAGSARKYPQPTETLTWSGDFYVPVHFANDEIDWEMILGGPYDTRLIAGPSVTLQEVRE
jgi:uncharacterized protein (TIGR02217 family)